MTARDRAGQRKVRLMTIWVGIGIALMVLGVYSSVWVIFLGACVVGSTPVFFTLRAALAPKPSAKPRAEAPRPVARSAGRRRAPARRRDHG